MVSLITLSTLALAQPRRVEVISVILLGKLDDIPVKVENDTFQCHEKKTAENGYAPYMNSGCLITVYPHNDHIAAISSIYNPHITG